jgi:hypothetical protein
MEKKMSDVAEIMNFEAMSIAALVDLKEQISEMIGTKRVAERAAQRAAERAEMAERGELKAVGRPENTGTFDDKWGIVEGLKLIAAKDGFYHYDDVGAAVSRVLTLQLVERGLVETHKAKVTEGPGRAKMFYRLTGKGRGYVGLSARWKQPE